MIKKVLYWLPRVLSGLLVVFFLAFALEGLQRWQDGLMHIVLALPFLALTIWAWKSPKNGGVVFMILGGILLLLIREEWASTIIWAIIFITGLLFYISSKKR